jgi:peptide/nickel transport system substrate-binding protein
MRQFVSLAAATLLIVAGCEQGNRPASEETSAVPGGTIVISSGGEPDVLLPPLMSTSTAHQVTELVYDHLADVGPSMNTFGDTDFQPALAKSWTWAPDSLSIQFNLDPAAKWHDGTPVRASDVVFTYNLYKDSATGSPTAATLVSIDSVTAPDSATAKVWFHARSPTQFYDAASQVLILPAHALKDVRGATLRTSSLARTPIGTGRFRFVSWKPGSSVEIVADTANYRGRPKPNRVIWSFSSDPNTAFTRLIGGEADLLEQITAPQMPQLEAHKELRANLIPGLDYNFISFNLRDPANSARPHPLFGDRELRRAMTMLVDRKRIVQSVYDSLAAPALGPTVRSYPTTDTTVQQIPYSPETATRLLDSLGWRVTGRDSIRRRNGKPLEFTLTVPGSSKNRVNMAVIVQNQLAQAGVTMNIDKLEFAAFIDRENKHAFDAIMGGWHVDPSPGGVRQTWGTAGTNQGGSNYGFYRNAVFDAQLDSALASPNADERRARFKRAYQTIIDDAPAIWLAEPKTIIAMQQRIHTPPLRADSWWANLSDWWIPAGQRIARDSAGVRQ